MCGGGMKKGMREVSRRGKVLDEHAWQKTPPHLRQCYWKHHDMPSVPARAR